MRKLERIKCNLCRKNDYKIIHKLKSKKFASYEKDLNYVKCKNCGLVYSNPRILFDIVKTQYNDKKYYTSIPEEEKTFTKREFKSLITAAFKKIEFIKKYKKNGKCLAVGSGRGTILDLLRFKGWDCYGVDVSKTAHKFTKEHLKLNTYNKELKEVKFKKEFFDMVIMFDVVEHLNNPYSTLKEVNRILKKDGILFVEIPILDSLHYKILKTKWESICPDQHLFMFTKETFGRMLNKTGFKTLKYTQKSGWNPLYFTTKNPIKFIVVLLFRIITIITNSGGKLVLVAKKK